MQIHTGYFAKARAYADAGYALVSIAKVDPWFLPNDLADKMFYLHDLAPTDEILALKDNPSEYVGKYTEQILSRLQPKAIYQRLWNFCADAKTDKCVLLCYEATEKFCHRHLVAKWLESSFGCDVCEVQLGLPTHISNLDDSDS